MRAMLLSVRRAVVLPLSLLVALAATGCLDLEATLTKDRPGPVTALTADRTCGIFRPRADATLVFEGTESSDPSVEVSAYGLPAGRAGSSSGTVIWSGGQGRKAPGDAVTGGLLYTVSLYGNRFDPVFPDTPPPPPWTTHIKVTVTAQDAAGNDVPLDCVEPPVNTGPTDTTNRGH
jgi:hypothetical protein